MLPKTKKFYENYWLKPETHALGILKQARRLAVIKSFLKTTNSHNLLIVGCGACLDIFIPSDGGAFSNKGIAVAFDLSYSGIKSAQKACKSNRYLVADAQYLPFKSGAFTCIICSEVLEHLTDPRKAILEFHRALCKDSHLIITTPNWISWYGLARKTAELFLKKPVTSANQPIDNWYTYAVLKKVVTDEFDIRTKRGVWYFPPTGRGMKVISSKISVPIYRLFQPLDRLLEILLPKYGHMLALLCTKKEKNG